MKNLPQNVKKILVIRYKFIGDTILTVPFLRNLKYQYPDAEIYMLTEPVSGQFLKNCPYITKLINYDKKAEYIDEAVINPDKKDFWGFVNLLRKEKFDLAFVLKRSFSSAMLTFFAGIPCRIGFDTELRGVFLTHKVNYDPIKHEAECYLDLLRAVDIPVADNYLEAWTTETEQQKVESLLNEHPTEASKKVLINACSYNINKMWHLSNYATVITELSNNYDCQVYYLGLEADSKVYDEIKNTIKTDLKYPPISLLGKTTLLESVEFIKRMDLVISVDSGIVHMAGAVNTPVMAIFGPMEDRKWAPFSDKNTVITYPVDCRPCNLCKDCNNEKICLTSISPHGVIFLAAKYLRE